MIKHCVGVAFLISYQNYFRLRSKIFSCMLSGSFAEFGAKSSIAPPARLIGINRIKVGNRVTIGANSWLITLQDKNNNSGAISIGDNTSIVGNCTISAALSISIEDNVLVAGNVYISDHIHKYSDRKVSVQKQGIDKIAPVTIRQSAWLGQNVVVGPGVTIGMGSVIGANSFVNKNIPDYCVAAGSPARIIKKIL